MALPHYTLVGGHPARLKRRSGLPMRETLSRPPHRRNSGMKQQKNDAYVPRADLGFPDRRKKKRVEMVFTGEAEVEDLETVRRALSAAEDYEVSTRIRR